MRQIFLVLSLLLLGMTWAAAQNSSQSSPSSGSAMAVRIGSAIRWRTDDCGGMFERFEWELHADR